MNFHLLTLSDGTQCVASQSFYGSWKWVDRARYVAPKEVASAVPLADLQRDAARWRVVEKLAEPIHDDEGPPHFQVTICTEHDTFAEAVDAMILMEKPNGYAP